MSVADLAHAGWFYGILLAERLPMRQTNAESLATCRALGERFVVEQRATVDVALANAKDTEDFVDAILPELLAWARTEGGIVFRSRPPEPYRCHRLALSTRVARAGSVSSGPMLTLPRIVDVQALEARLDAAAREGVREALSRRPPPTSAQDVLQTFHAQFYREQVYFSLHSIAERSVVEMQAIAEQSGVVNLPVWGFDEGLDPPTRGADLRARLVAQCLPIVDSSCVTYDQLFSRFLVLLQESGFISQRAAISAANQAGDLAANFLGPLGTYLASLAAGSIAAQQVAMATQEAARAVEVERQAVFSGMANAINSAVPMTIEEVRAYRGRVAALCSQQQ